MTPNPTYSGLLTDLYELTMAAGYLETGFEACATFELFVRSLPPRRNYLVAAGLDQALDFLEGVRFSDEEIEYLRTLPVFAAIGGNFFEYLSRFRFSGDVWAMPEGTVFFPGEPILRVTAPVIEAQIVETFLLSAINFQTMIASKAARITQAAAGKNVIEFGTRRAHGMESGVLAARAAVIGGCLGTSNVAAGERFGISVYGTQAHSWIMAHEDEGEAFRKFLDIFPEQAVLLVDTYDVRAAVEKIIALGRKPRGVRLDSGDFAADSKWIRRQLDRAGWENVIIFASGDLDEDRIAALLAEGACIDGFGVGTALVNSSDSPALGVIYKLVETEFHGEVRSAAKFSAAKVTYPGKKQVYRYTRPDGSFEGDIIGLAGEHFPGSKALLEPVMVGGKRSVLAPDLLAAREYCRRQKSQLPQRLHSLSDAVDPYSVWHSEKLKTLLGDLRRRLERAPGIRASSTNWQDESTTTRANKMVSRSAIFWNVDTQADFMLPGGKLYVPGAEKLIPNLNRLTDAARQGRVFLVGDCCAHAPDDPEFARFPPHCVRGTPGAEIIPEARAEQVYLVPNRAGAAIPEDLSSFQEVLLEKQTLDVFDNSNTETVLEHIGKFTDADAEFYVFGVVTEFCVRLAAKGLLDRGRRVALVRDAIETLNPEDGRAAIAELTSLGARLVTTDQALAALDLSRSHSARS